MTKIKDLKQGVNSIALLVMAVEGKTTKTQKSYVVFKLSDGETTIEAKRWDSELSVYEWLANKVVRVGLNVGTYNGTASYEVVTLMEEKTAKVSDFVLKVPVDSETMFSYLVNVPIHNPELKYIVNGLLNSNKERLMYWAAAKSIHHALYGGLLYHMYRMTQSAEKLCLVYDDVNKDLLLAGTILHDIGKLEELDVTPLGESDFSLKGRLFGHLYLGMQMVRDTATNKGSEIVMQLLHMIASHHGKIEYGAISLPATREAEILHELDMLDSRLYQYEDEYKKIEAGETSDKVFGLGCTIYKPAK